MWTLRTEANRQWASNGGTVVVQPQEYPSANAPLSPPSRLFQTPSHLANEQTTREDHSPSTDETAHILNLSLLVYVGRHPAYVGCGVGHEADVG